MQKFCTSPQLSTCGNARFQLIKLYYRNKKRKIDIPANKTQKTKVPCLDCGKLFIRISAHKCKAVPTMRL